LAQRANGWSKNPLASAARACDTAARAARLVPCPEIIAMSQGFEPINPYHSPQSFPGQYQFAPAPAAEESLPTYCKVMFIIDLVMSGLRLVVS